MSYLCLVSACRTQDKGLYRRARHVDGFGHTLVDFRAALPSSRMRLMPDALCLMHSALASPEETATSRRAGGCGRRWVELRHKHFGFASQRVATLLDEFRAKNRVASYKGGADGSALDMRAMRGLVASLPQYRRARPNACPNPYPKPDVQDSAWTCAPCAAWWPRCRSTSS